MDEENRKILVSQQKQKASRFLSQADEMLTILNKQKTIDEEERLIDGLVHACRCDGMGKGKGRGVGEPHYGVWEHIR